MNIKKRFNIVRYKELELLVNTESSKTNKKEFFELLKYQASVETQFLWEEKNEYLELIQKYLDEKISPGNFRYEYLDMGDKNDKKVRKIFNNLDDNLDELSNFWLHPGGKTVGSLLNKISSSCQGIVEFGSLEDNGEDEENEFRKFIEKILLEVVLEIKKYDSSND